MMSKTTEIAIYSDNRNLCSTNCQYYYFAGNYGDCYAINCGLYNKPLGWHPSVKRCEECLKSTNEFKTKKENKKD